MAGISRFLVCKVFNLCWGGHSQGSQEKDCQERGRNSVNQARMSR